jgi:hypothetical protein
MSSSISSSSTSTAALEELEQEYIEYLESMGIDADDVSLIDNEGNLDTTLYSDATLNPYFQLAFTQFIEMVYQPPINSDSGEVMSFNELAEWLFEEDPEFYDFVIATLNSDEDLLAYFAAEAGGDSEGQYVLSQISDMDLSSDSDSDSDEYENHTTDYANYMLDKYNLGGLLELSINSEDATNATLNSLFSSLNELSQSKIELAQLLAGDELTSTEYEVYSQDLMMTEQAIFAQISYLTDMNATLQETLTNIEKRNYDTRAAAVRNYK